MNTTPLPAAAAAMTKDALDGLRDALAKASGLPWKLRFKQRKACIDADDADIPWRSLAKVVIRMNGSDDYSPEGQANAALIVAAVNALPGLLDRLERAEKDRDIFKAADESMQQAHYEAIARADALAAENERLREAAIEAVPMNWCDSLLTGPNAGKIPLDCPGVERLLRGIRDRLREALAANPQGATDERA